MISGYSKENIIWRTRIYSPLKSGRLDGKKLFSMYPDRCLKVLANAADRQARTSKNRRDYKYIARTLKKMVAHPGGREIAAELAVKYRTQYPRRSAMIDELKRF